MEKITTNLITSYKKMTKKQFTTYSENMSKKDIDIMAILEKLSKKPRFSIDMVQKEYLEISKHFTSEKNTEKTVNSSDLVFIKNVFKVCFYMAFTKNIYIDIALQNGIVTFLKSKNNPFVIGEDKTITPKTIDEQFKECFAKCTDKIKLENLSQDTLKEVMNTLKKYIK